MFGLAILPLLVLGVWVAWEPMKSCIQRDKTKKDLQWEQVREDVLEDQAAINVMKADNDNEEQEIKI